MRRTVIDFLLMLIPDLPDEAQIKYGVGRIENRGVGHLLQFVAKPAVQRDCKALLWPMENVDWQGRRERLFENMFCLAAPQLQRRRDPRYEFHEAVIQDWCAHFKGDGHAKHIFKK